MGMVVVGGQVEPLSFVQVGKGEVDTAMSVTGRERLEVGSWGSTFASHSPKAQRLVEENIYNIGQVVKDSFQGYPREISDKNRGGVRVDHCSRMGGVNMGGWERGSSRGNWSWGWSRSGDGDN